MNPKMISASALCELAHRAGQRILHLRDQNLLNPQRKDDGSPVTEADLASQKIILEGLSRLTPSIPVIAEEQDHADEPTNHQTYWLVDPLDGTRDFLTGRDDFSVNMGLVHNGVPVIGVIYAPARDDLVFGSPEQSFRILKSTQTSIMVPRATIYPPRLTISLRDAKTQPTDVWKDKGLVRDIAVRASAYKIALVAVGEADLFIRMSVTYEWDTAAGHAILNAQGGHVITPDEKPLTYMKPNLTNGKLAACRSDFDLSRLDQFWDDPVGSTSKRT
ncbi:MAG: 3'(2'),5'-bisphosphate nucleotidase CysQ [Alphaproteobacteria bacterium]|nr:3'(2'),5'-bisphosphate nucleotidase CysQ [Alphaproteobacteria bacterium]